MINNLKNNEVIIYDGICVLCNKYIKWVLDKDKENFIKALPLSIWIILILGIVIWGV